MSTLVVLERAAKAAPAPLEFTGERYTPECPREMLYEHFARYAMALEFAAGKRVLDCACGEGYGSNLLAERALSVLGLDYSNKAVAHARARYQKSNLRFEVADATALSLENCVDVVVSFETLEHLDAQDAMLAGFKRALTNDGLLLLSSPDKLNYSDIPRYHNEFHVKELYRSELEALLARHFKHVCLYAQKLKFQSFIWDVSANSTRANGVYSASLQRDGRLTSGLQDAPMYYIALASDSAEVVEARSAALFLFADQAQSLYQHYQAEIRNGIYAAKIIAELRAEIARLRAG